MGLITNGSTWNIDAITNERIMVGDKVLQTTQKNEKSRFPSRNRFKMIKEDTLVRLAAEAGFKLVPLDERDAGDSGNAESVDGADAGVGGGEGKARKAKAGRKPASKRSTDGESEG